MSKYARELTKQDLVKSGITDITDDCKVFRNGKQIKLYVTGSGNFKYLAFNIYDFDSEGKPIKVPCKQRYTVADGSVRSYDSYKYKSRTVALSRAVWAWHNDTVKAGYVVDHIFNSLNRLIPANNSLNKLQMITP